MTEEDVTAVTQCLRSGWLTLGPRTKELEAAAAARLGVAHVVATSSGAAAILLALRALRATEVDLGPDPSPAALGAVRFLGCTEVPGTFVHCTPVPGTSVQVSGPEGAREAAGDRVVIVDLTRAAGADRPPALAWAWSLPVGDGGLLATDDPELDAKVRSLRSHAMTSGTWDRHRGHEDSYDIVDLGFNFRLDEPRAALATARLDRLDEWPPGV